MGLNITATEHKIDYPAFFRSKVVVSAKYILTRIKPVQAVLSADDRNLALHTLSFALGLAEAWPHTREILLTLAPQMEQAGYRDEWIPYLDEGIRQSITFGDLETTAELELQLGILYQLRSKYEQARTHLEASARGFERLDTPRRHARALNQLAYVARMQRRFEEAIGLVETVHQSLTEVDEERAFGYYVLGLVALDHRDWQQAVDFSKQAFGLWATTNNWRMMGRSLLCCGVALQEMKQYSEAIKVDEQAITFFEKSQDSFRRAIAQMNLGIVYYMLDQPQQALTLYLPAQKIFRQVQDQYHLALVTHNMGRSYRKLGQWAEARMVFEQSVDLKRKLGNVALLVNSMDGLGLVYLAEGKYVEARDIFQEALTWLAQIEDEAWYDHLYEMVSNHLQEISERINNNK